MLHLAQVQNNQSVGGVELRLLAYQQSENSWAVIDPQSVLLNNVNSLQEGLLVLVDLSDNKEVLRIQDAQDWVLDLVQKYLTGGTASTFLQEEAERAEQWRQDLTLQSQDLTRRNLELEARREQIQTLEEDLKEEKQQLEEITANLRAREEDLNQQRQQIEKLAAQLEQEKQQLEERAAQVKQKTDSEHF
jgi:DNA repair exonuclease SbcCD ATPase subunit